MMDGGSVAFWKGIYHIKRGVMREAWTPRCLNDTKYKSPLNSNGSTKEWEQASGKALQQTLILFWSYYQEQDTDSHNFKQKTVGSVCGVSIMMLNGYVVPADLSADIVVFRQSLLTNL